MPRSAAFRAFAALALTIPASALVASPAFAAEKGSTSPINVENGLALHGYDAVAYFADGTPTKGNPAIVASYQGVRYQFATEAHRKAFEAAPASYAPQFGGYCALGTAYGEKVDTDPTTGKVVNGKLYLNYNHKTAERWNTDKPGFISKAEANWASVKDKPL